MSLSDLMKTGLPLNRKERFYTGTVFPMIVCANSFRDLGVLARLIPGCELPAIDPDPEATNIQFFTEYSLVESIFGAGSKARFPDPPKTKDTPDIMILTRDAETVLIAIEAKMYHQPQLHSLVTQLKAQQAQLSYLRDHLEIDRVHHIALLPAGYAKTIGEYVSLGSERQIPVVTWEALLGAYREVRQEDNYFMGVLDLALRHWHELCSQPLAYGVNAQTTLAGLEVLRRFRKHDPRVSVVGRSGGLYGPLLQKDLATGDWRTHQYEVSSVPEPPNKNWLFAHEFAQLVESVADAGPDSQGKQATSHVRSVPARKWKMDGLEIREKGRDQGVQIVGRNGGVNGRAFITDVETGDWMTWAYEVSTASAPLNKNWFTLEDFMARLSITGDGERSWPPYASV